MAKIRLFGVDLVVPSNDGNEGLFGVDVVAPCNNKEDDTSLVRVYNPIPLRMCSPKYDGNEGLFGVDVVAPCNDKEDDASMLRVYNPIPLRMCPPKLAEKRKRCMTMGRESKKPRVTEDEDEDESAPNIPQELLRAIGQRQGAAEPVFLYEKKLEQSDTRKSQNRLFINKKGRFKKFLNEQEWSLIGTGIEKIPCVDARGGNYTSRLKMWKSLDKLIIKSRWYKLFKSNSVEQGDWAQIWGYREEGRICFAINFKKA